MNINNFHTELILNNEIFSNQIKEEEIFILIISR